MYEIQYNHTISSVLVCKESITLIKHTKTNKAKFVLQNFQRLNSAHGSNVVSQKTMPINKALLEKLACVAMHPTWQGRRGSKSREGFHAG